MKPRKGYRYTPKETNISSFYGVTHDDWDEVKKDYKLPYTERSMADHIGMPKHTAFRQMKSDK